MPFLHRAQARVRSVATWLAALVLMAFTVAAPAAAGCGDRPGTPVDMTATLSDNQIQLDFTNTASEAPIYWDIEVTDGAGHYLAGGVAGVRGTRTQATGGDYSEMGRFQLVPIQGSNFTPNTHYCFRVRARTAGGKEGCVSKLWNNPVCVTTPDTAVNQFCSTYARDAINQFNYLRNVKMAGNCGDEGARWTSTWLEHYNWCIAVRPNPQSAGAPDFEREERNKRLRVCSGYECFNSVCKQFKPLKPIKTGKSTTTPAPPPTPPENQCKYTVWVTNDECVNVDGTPMSNNPPGVMQTFGCGATEDEALQRAKAAFHLEQGPQLSDDDTPCPGCCTYKKKVSKSCACPIRTYSKKVEEKSCLRGMVLIGGSCRCKPGERWNGRFCRRFGSTPAGASDGTSGPPSTPTCPRDRPIGTPPNCCPEGTTFDGGVCRAPTRTTPSPECTGDRPVGTYPNCCPRGTFFSDGKCRTGGGGTNGTRPGGGGTVGQPRCTGDRPVGTYPNCCPTGTFFSDGKCRTGSGGTNGTQPGGGTGGEPGCRGDRPVGTPPNCCPRGTSFQNGKCIRPTTTTNPSGNGGTSGTKTCPPGTHATRSGQCEPDASPTTPTSKGRCTGGRVGTPPRCFCPGGRRFIGGRCRSIPKTAPAPTGPTPKKICPSGLTGPNCDQVIVR